MCLKMCGPQYTLLTWLFPNTLNTVTIYTLHENVPYWKIKITHKLHKNLCKHDCYTKEGKKNSLEIGDYVMKTVCNAEMFLKFFQNSCLICLEPRLSTLCVFMLPAMLGLENPGMITKLTAGFATDKWQKIRHGQTLLPLLTKPLECENYYRF